MKINARFENQSCYLIFDLWLLWRYSFYFSQKTCRPFGSEALPEGIVSKTSNFEMRPLWGDVEVFSYFSRKLFMSFFVISQSFSSLVPCMGMIMISWIIHVYSIPLCFFDTLISSIDPLMCLESQP